MESSTSARKVKETHYVHPRLSATCSAGSQDEIDHGSRNRSRTIPVAPADDVYRYRSDIHAPAGHISWGMESHQRSAAAKRQNPYSPAWIQAHGHAQTVRLGGHVHSGNRFLLDTEAAKAEAVCPLVRMAYVGALGHWRDRPLVIEYLSVALAVALPSSAALELAAFLVFFQAVASHRPSGVSPKPLEPWDLVVIAATIGLLASLLLNLGASFQLALNAQFVQRSRTCLIKDI